VQGIAREVVLVDALDLDDGPRPVREVNSEVGALRCRQPLGLEDVAMGSVIEVAGEKTLVSVNGESSVAARLVTLRCIARRWDADRYFSSKAAVLSSE
jgi:hypothetical protein